MGEDCYTDTENYICDYDWYGGGGGGGGGDGGGGGGCGGTTSDTTNSGDGAGGIWTTDCGAVGSTVPPCPPENPLCKLPMRPSDTLQVTQALDSTLLRTTWTSDSAKTICTQLFNLLKTDWTSNRSMFFRGNVSIPDYDGHDGYFDGTDLHIDQDYLDAHHPSGEVLALLLHEIAHSLNFFHPNDDANPDFVNGYHDYPFNFTSSPSGNSCVPGSWQ